MLGILINSLKTGVLTERDPLGSPASFGFPVIDFSRCTACDECTNLNPKVFAYGPGKKAFIKDAAAGPYSDLVKAAERCTASVIHPGLPRDRSGKDVEKWIARARKYN